MKRIIYILFVLSSVAFFHPDLTQAEEQNIYRIYINSPEQFKHLLNQNIDIIATNYGKSIDIQCTNSEAEEISSHGLHIEFLMNENEALTKKQLPAGFLNYEETKTFLHAFSLLYPSITILDSIGTSIENRGLWALKISDNPGKDEDEPCLLIEGCIHGNENHTLEICIYFIQYLLENYGKDQEVTHWVDNREIWIVPLVNPDGHERNNRYNANNVDLNRNFGYWWGFTASRYGTTKFSEPETQAIRDLAISIKPYGSLAFHTSGRIIIYPWAYNSLPKAPDNELFVEITEEMADSINSVDPYIQYYTRRSGSWYWHGGEHNDWMYSQYGMLSCTIELMPMQSAPPSDHENEVALPSFKVMLRRPEKCGITGLITDATTFEPLSANVKIIELFDEEKLEPRTSEPRFGRYIRFLTKGTYTVEFYKPGYRREIRKITINENDSIQNIDIQLKKDADIVHIYSIVKDIITDESTIRNQDIGNGLLNRGETVDLDIFIKNIGTQIADSVYGILSAESSNITILQDSAYFGEIDSGKIVSGIDFYRLSVSSNVRPGTKCNMHIDFFDKFGTHWKSTFYERVQGFCDDMEIEGRDQWTYYVAENIDNTDDGWQYGLPAGKGNDPMSAHSQNFVWGNDLGTGYWDGKYKNDTFNFLQMRTLDCSGWNTIYLQFYRWLNISNGDQAYISINDEIIWENFNLTISESNWSFQLIDISSIAAFNDSVVIRFGLKTNSTTTNGGWTIDDVFVHSEILVNIEKNKTVTRPSEFYLYNNYPNPFNASTKICFDLPELQHVKLEVYNLLGQKVKTIISSELPAGTYNFSWDGNNDNNSKATSGVYFIKLLGENSQLIRKVLMLK